MPGYNLRSRKVETSFLNNNEDIEDIEDIEATTIERASSPISTSAEISNGSIVCELETLRENNKNLYSKYNNISRSKYRMKNIISEKDEKITQLENKIKELLENKKNYTESKDLSDDWVSLE
jgi:hypothetical protein